MYRWVSQSPHLLLTPTRRCACKSSRTKDTSTRSPKRSSHYAAGEEACRGSSQPQFMSSPYPQPSIHVRSPSHAQQPSYMLTVSRPSAPSHLSSLVSSSSSSLAPSDSISVVCSSIASSRSQHGQHDLSSALPADLLWTDAHQAYFEDRIMRLTVSAGLPLSWVENPEWLNFCTEFVPQAKSPSHKVLT
jgi:hypothetical protein